MNKLNKLKLVVLMGSLLGGTAALAQGNVGISVNEDNFNQAVTDKFMSKWNARGADMELQHLPSLAPAGTKASVVRMNQDSLYSFAILRADDEGYVHVGIKEHQTKQGVKEVYTSVHVLDQNSSSPAYKVGTGDYKIKIETEWAFVIFRAGVEDKDNLQDAKYAQKRFYVDMSHNGEGWEPAGYDRVSLNKVETRLKKEFLAAGEDFIYYESADAPNIDRGRQTRSNAMGWGGMPVELGVSNIYRNTKQFDGSQCQQITFEEPNNKYFTSITLYDETGYMLETERFSINSYEWDVNKDGTVTISFGCGDGAPNNLVTNGQDYNYSVRNYGVSTDVQYDKFGGRELKYLSGGQINPDYK